MTIDEAIRHAEEVAEDNEAAINWQGTTETMKKRCFECAAEHRQLAEWLRELKELRNSVGAVKLKDMKEAKRLLRYAVKDFREIAAQFEDEYGHCMYSGNCDKCKLNGGNVKDACQWIYEAEALKLIGEE